MKDRNQEQYEHDPAFHAFADLAYRTMSDGQLTPEEMRRAVMHGAIRYEMHNVRPIEKPPLGPRPCIPNYGPIQSEHDFSGGLHCVRCGWSPALQNATRCNALGHAWSEFTGRCRTCGIAKSDFRAQNGGGA